MLRAMFALQLRGSPDMFSQHSGLIPFGSLDLRRRTYEESLYSRSYCLREILYEQYLWDMRCWHKPKYDYSHEEIKEHIRQWLANHYPNNCGHCLYCIRKLLVMKWASLDEITRLVRRNPYVSNSLEIGSWDRKDNKEIMEAGRLSELPVSQINSLKEKE
jgi:hypothetical protein